MQLLLTRLALTILDQQCGAIRHDCAAIFTDISNFKSLRPATQLKVYLADGTEI